MRPNKKVMVFGTFDILHPGHINFFKQAKKYGDNLVVVVARDINVKKIKGQKPRLGERKRLANIKQVKIVSEAVLGDLKNPYKIIEQEQPASICLGYDQKGFALGLTDRFPKIKIFRLKAYKPKIYKSSILK